METIDVRRVVSDLVTFNVARLVIFPRMSGLRNALYGNDGRIRATLRVLPTVPLYVLSLLAVRAGVSALGAPLENIQTYIVQAGVLTVVFSGVFLLWSRRIDRRPLQEYGITADTDALVNFFVGAAVVITGYALWIGVSTAAGATELTLVMNYYRGAFVPAAVLISIGIVLGAFVQDLLYLALILTNSIEGISAQLSSSSVAVVGGTVVTSVVFVGYHFLLGMGVAGYLQPVEATISLLTGILFLIAVYLLSNSLAMAVGSHGAFNAAQGLLFVRETGPVPAPTVFRVDGSLLPSVLGTARVAESTIAFLLLLGALRLVRGISGVDETVSKVRVSGD